MKWNYVGYHFSASPTAAKQKSSGLEAIGVPKRQIFFDQVRNFAGARPNFDKCLKHLRPGDRMVFPSLTDISRSIDSTLIIVQGLVEERAVEVEIIGGNLLFTNSPLSNDVPKASEFFSELRANFIEPRYKKASKSSLGRPPALNEMEWTQACMLAQQGYSGHRIWLEFPHVSRATIFRYLTDFRANRQYPFSGNSSHHIALSHADWSYL